MADGLKLEQRHGKSRVRVARVWRNVKGDARDVIVEWTVGVSLLSDCLPAYTSGDNSTIVATDTMKNTVYVKAKECLEVISVEEFAILLAKHFTSFYPQVTAAIITIVEKPWERISIDGRSHKHGFKLGSEKHTAEVTIKKCGSLEITSGIDRLSLLKTTKAGFEGFVRDQYTVLPDTRERMLATEVTALWSHTILPSSLSRTRYVGGECYIKFVDPEKAVGKKLSDVPLKPFCFTKMYMDVKKVLIDTFFGPSHLGVYSPSVQNTLFLMGKAVLNRFPDIALIQIKMPNIHFLPVNLSSKDNATIVKFADDVYTPTDEPHGTIEATLTRVLSKI